MILVEQFKESLRNYQDSVNKFQNSVRRMDSVHVEEQLARKAIMEDCQLSFNNYASWIRGSDEINLDEIEIDL